jgi:plastocyanin
MRSAAVLSGLALVAALGAPPTVAQEMAAPTRLNGTVGPGFTITLTKGGQAVETLKPGEYAIKVRDRSENHNFHLKGPGVDKKTAVGREVTVTWNVTLQRGKYRFQCDPHASSMNGSFTVKR